MLTALNQIRQKLRFVFPAYEIEMRKESVFLNGMAIDTEHYDQSPPPLPEYLGGHLRRRSPDVQDKL